MTRADDINYLSLRIITLFIANLWRSIGLKSHLFQEMTNSGRPRPRIGGLKKQEAKGTDGLR